LRKALEVRLAESYHFRYISFQERKFAFLERLILDDVLAEFKKYVFVTCQIHERLLLITIFNQSVRFYDNPKSACATRIDLLYSRQDPLIGVIAGTGDYGQADHTRLRDIVIGNRFNKLNIFFSYILSVVFNNSGQVD